MDWKINFDKKALKDLEKLDKINQKRIVNFISKLKSYSDPRQTGKCLTGNHKSFWRYRVGDYRIICQIKDEELIVLVIALGHRNKIYKILDKV